MDGIFLVEPQEQHREGYLKMVSEYKNFGEEHYFDMYKEALEDFDGYILKLKSFINGQEDWVPSYTFWLTNMNKDILGVVRIRMSLENDYVRKYAGHIGYDISPMSRKKGYGTALLKLALEKAAQLGHDKVLVTCDDDNIGSAKIIEKNGGVLESRILKKDNKTQLRRYWISIK
jgi:predicted acetyltransferase